MIDYSGFDSTRDERPCGNFAMQFIEMTGRTLLEMTGVDALNVDELRQLGVKENSVVRINRQGDIEIRRRDKWDCIGGLLGDYEHRIREATGIDWAKPYAD